VHADTEKVVQGPCSPVKETVDLSKRFFQFVNCCLVASKNDALIGVNQDDAVITNKVAWINFNALKPWCLEVSVLLSSKCQF
jgi:hypothetical protein